MFKISQSNTYLWPVTVEMPDDGGKFTKHTFDAEFRRLSVDELSALGDTDDTGGTACRRILAGWKGVVDDNGEPLANTAIKIHQLVPAGERFFCLSIPTLGGGGKSCTLFEKFPIFKGEFPASGSLDFTAEYLTGLYIEIAESCDNADPKARRRYFRRTMYTGDLMDKETITMSPLDKAYLGYYIRYKPCTIRTPLVENWDDYY